MKIRTLTRHFRQQYYSIKNHSKQSEIMKMGGDTSTKTIQEWSKTVLSNPAIIKIAVAPLLDLLTSENFPKDPFIEQKRTVIKQAQEQYISNSAYCKPACSSHGKCSPIQEFKVGRCVCAFGWNGSHCQNDHQQREVGVRRHNWR